MTTQTQPIAQTKAQMAERARRIALTEAAIRQRDEFIARNAAQAENRQMADKGVAIRQRDDAIIMINNTLEALTPDETERFNSEFVKFLGLGVSA